MADEPLIMRAGISYDPTPLNQLKRQLDGLKSGSAAVIRKDFDQVRGSVSKAAAEIRNSLTPAMAAMGIGSLGVAGAITGVIAAVKSLTSGLTEMRMASKETGATIQELRELQALGKRFDIGPDAMSGGVAAFSDTMRQIKNKWGETYEWMRTASPEMAELGKKLFNAKNMDEALESAMAGIAGIKNPKVRQMLSEKLFGSKIFSQLGSEGGQYFKESREDVHNRTPSLPPDADKVAREFKESMDRIGDAAVNMQTQFAKALLPVLPEIRTGIDEFTEFLRSEKKEISGFFTEVVADARSFVHDLRDHFDNLRSGYEAAKNFFGGSQTGGATHGIMPEASIGETMRNADISGRRLQMDELRRRMAVLDEAISRKESAPDPLGGEGHATASEERRRRDKLNEELKRLSDEIAALHRDGATVQKQSFDGGGGFGGMIQRASFGGGLGGGGYPGGRGGAAGSSGLTREGVERAGRAAREGFMGSAGVGAQTGDKTLDAIIAAEGTAKGGRDPFNTVLGYGKYGTPPKPLTEMTLKEVYEFGRQVRARHGTSSALGAFQIVGRTMRSVGMPGAGLGWDDRFSRENQIAMARAIWQAQGPGAWEGFKFHPDLLAQARRGGRYDVGADAISARRDASDNRAFRRSEPWVTGSARRALPRSRTRAAGTAALALRMSTRLGSARA